MTGQHTSAGMGKKTRFHRLLIPVGHLLASAVICFASFNGIITSQQQSLLERLFDAPYHDALLVGAGASVSILLLLLFDDLNSKLDVFAVLSRWVLLLGIQVPDSICLSHVRSGDGNGGLDASDRFARFYISSATFKLAISVCCICTIVCSKSSCLIMKAKSPCNPVHQGYLLIFTSLVYQLVALSGYRNFGDTTSASASAIYAGNLILCFMLLQVVLMCGTCIHNFYSSVDYEGGDDSVDNGDEFVVCVCLGLLLFRMASSVWILIYCCSFIEGYWKMSSNLICTDTLIQLSFMVGVIVLPWPHVRAKIFHLMESTLRENTALMAYIAHEVRSPLNVAHLSLRFMRNEALALKAAVDDEEMATLVDAIEDVDDACKAATSILNDFLLFDKMKGGVFSFICWLYLH